MSPLFTTEACKAFTDHWFALKGADAMPALSAFLDKPEPKLQPRVILSDLVSSDILRFHLAGTAFIRDLDQEVTGMNMLDFSDPSFAAQAVRINKTVRSHPCGMRGTGIGLTTAGRVAPVELAAYPLSRVRTLPIVVSIVEPISALKFGEHVERFQDIREISWIDIGCGLPAA